MRTDFLHKLSTKVTIENQVVALEDLNVKGLLKNRKLSKAISRLRALCEGKGKYASSTDGKLLAKSAQNAVGISTRVVVCDNCGAVHDRDENASKNIEQVGMGHRLTSKKRTWRQSKTSSLASVDETSRILGEYVKL
jgi:putative transposase